MRFDRSNGSVFFSQYEKFLDSQLLTLSLLFSIQIFGAFFSVHYILAAVLDIRHLEKRLLDFYSRSVDLLMFWSNEKKTSWRGVLFLWSLVAIFSIRTRELRQTTYNRNLENRMYRRIFWIISYSLNECQREKKMAQKYKAQQTKTIGIANFLFSEISHRFHFYLLSLIR